MRRLVYRVILAFLMVGVGSAIAFGQCQPCTASEPLLLEAPGYTVSEGGDVVERIAVHSVVRESDGTEIGAIYLRKFLDDAPTGIVQGIVDLYTSGYVGMDGAAAMPINVNGVLWYRVANGMMDEWHRYNEALHALIQYIQPVSRVSDIEATAFLAVFDQMNRRYVPVLADFTPVPGYAFREGDELYKSIGVYDVDRISDGLDLGGIDIYWFREDAPQEMKAFIIDRFTTSRFGTGSVSAAKMDVSGVTWYYWQDGTIGKWHRYDEVRDAVLQYAYPVARISDADARSFLQALGGQAGEASVEPAVEVAPPTTSTSYLFVQEAESGQLVDNGDGTFALILADVDPQTLVFADRPVREAFHVETSRFVDTFGWMFAGDPPNAAVSSVPMGGGPEQAFVFVIDTPTYSPETGTLTYSAIHIPASSAGVVTLPAVFGQASLFIDSDNGGARAPHPRAGDQDGDGFPDGTDRCPAIPGPCGGCGCGDTDDIDHDSIGSKYDFCPFIGASWDNLGCPPSDRDGDGVQDNWDRCPDTPSTPGVDPNHGCPISDRDGDGFGDLTDFCPDTPGDFHGCPEFPTDGDLDGVLDNADNCPNTPGPSENGGCPYPDTDGDGVDDHSDNCPNTPGIAACDGCPDGDGDGVCDAKDSCPDTTGDASCAGCPSADKDGDGVCDAIDQCPDTPGSKASGGCPDGDGDGVADADDLCPVTPGPKEHRGCPNPLESGGL